VRWDYIVDLLQNRGLPPLHFFLTSDPSKEILEPASANGLLHKIRRRGTMLRTSLYGDDAAIFLAPYGQDIQNLASILHGLGEVTGLSTNFHNNFVVPLCCEAIDLDGILVLRATLSLKYLGLPLSVGCLRGTDFQPLEDKMAGNILTWNGKFFTMAGRTTLVKSILASKSTYHLIPVVLFRLHAQHEEN
jgi:hypothetical protein